MLAAFLTHWQKHSNRRTSIIAVTLGTIAIVVYVFVIQPPDQFPLQRLVTIDDGSSLSQAASELKAAHVIRSTLALEVLVTLGGHEHSVHAGDYLFKQPESVFEIARTISVGAFGLEPTRFRVVEGTTVKQMANLFGPQLERFDEQRFLANALPQEGYLFPDTYFFLPNATDQLVIQSLRQNFDTQMASVTPAIATSRHSLADIITMASILEREARTTSDRKMIAGVLWNRLARGMPLQVDATFLYTIGKGTFQLTGADLTNEDDPYNTYTHKGLPPTPIGSPSMDSILAALDPTKNNYLYYLADKAGVTHYSKTYAQHLQQKALYLGN